MFPVLMGTVVLAGIIGYISERTGWTRNGILQSVIICVGGALVFFFISLMFNVGFRSAGLNTLASAVGALIIVPFHWRR